MHYWLVGYWTGTKGDVAVALLLGYMRTERTCVAESYGMDSLITR